MSMRFLAWSGWFFCGSLLGAPVDDRMSVDVDGASLYLEVAGASGEAPLLLYLHGGPGNAVFGIVGFKADVGARLEEDLLVAYLHQRGAGKSPPVPDAEQTIANHVNDVDEVVDFLAEKYSRNEVHLVGHSWGGTLAALYAARQGEKIGKLVFISAAFDMKSVLRDSHAATLEWAMEENLTDAVEVLQRVDVAFETAQDFGRLSTWANQARGGVMRSIDMAAFMETHRIDTNYPDWSARQPSIARAMLPQMLAVNLASALPAFTRPALFVSARDDTIVPVQSTRRDFEAYGGAKQFVILEDSHHLPFIDQPERLAEEIVRFIKGP